jgi:(Z)-2-((N-methylformamido)methylene)-5-hydroxybutyrolactone dehydrogenase
MKKYNHFINGCYVEPNNRKWLDTKDPFTGETWAYIPHGNQADVEAAVSAAQIAMTVGPWGMLSPSQRGALLRRLADLISVNIDYLAPIEVRDNGKLLAEVRGQLNGLSNYWHYYAGLADKIHGETIPIDKSDMVAYTLREPVGVVAALTAWNSPLGFVAQKCAPALAAGCSVVVKPSEFASVSTLEFAALTKEAGIPDGVFNVICGLGAEVGASLVEHPKISMVSFTGSDETGARIYSTAAKLMKRVALELGGKSPNIVFQDADLDLAAAGVISGIFGAAGQMCTAGSRLLVHASIQNEFTSKLVELARSIKLGDPSSPETNVGPIATYPQFQKIVKYLELARQDGARCILGGQPAVGNHLGANQFVEPTIFTDVKPTMRIAKEEVFGPILAILSFETEEEAIKLANDVSYGLVAGVWTKSLSRAMRIPKHLKVGTVWVNTYRTYSAMVPFGGMKASGIGRENGIEAINEYLETKSVIISTTEQPPINAFIMR